MTEEQVRAMLPALRASNIKLYLGDMEKYSPSLSIQLSTLNKGIPLMSLLLSLGHFNQPPEEEKSLGDGISSAPAVLP